MISGKIAGNEGRIRVRIKGPRGRSHEVAAVIDTGYTEWLTLPPATVAALGLRWRSVDRGTLADGSECLFDVYVATVAWDGAERRILVDEADAEPLVGMALLRGYELKMQVWPHGKVTIKRRARP